MKTVAKLIISSLGIIVDLYKLITTAVPKNELILYSVGLSVSQHFNIILKIKKTN